MIKLAKQPKPKILTDNSANWTAIILAKIASGEKPTTAEASKYRHRDIKQALELETQGKCAYCESKLKHIHHGDVEHIYPKSLDPTLQFEWENLTLACEVCNQNKSNKDPYLNHIIDPYKKDPSEHITFIGPVAFPLGTAEGISSITLLDLNRPALTVMRNETVQKIMTIFDTLFRTEIPIPARKFILQDLETNAASDSAQYSAVAKEIIEKMKKKLPPELL